MSDEAGTAQMQMDARASQLGKKETKSVVQGRQGQRRIVSAVGWLWAVDQQAGNKNLVRWLLAGRLSILSAYYLSVCLPYPLSASAELSPLSTASQCCCLPACPLGCLLFCA